MSSEHFGTPAEHRNHKDSMLMMLKSASALSLDLKSSQVSNLKTFRLSKPEMEHFMLITDCSTCRFFYFFVCVCENFPFSYLKYGDSPPKIFCVWFTIVPLVFYLFSPNQWLISENHTIYDLTVK